jgi:hypothetical protein
MRMQAEDTLLPDSCDTVHSMRATSWATGFSQSTLPLAPDTAAAKVQGVENPGGEAQATGRLLISSCKELA